MVKPPEKKMRAEEDVARDLDALWSKHLPTILGRIDVISAIAQAQNVSNEVRLQAAMEAHKLAGSLGTFGLRSASHDALEIESMLANALPINSVQLTKVEEVVERIRRAVLSR